MTLFIPCNTFWRVGIGKHHHFGEKLLGTLGDALSLPVY
jgi:hypothetical protein